MIILAIALNIVFLSIYLPTLVRSNDILNYDSV